MFRYFGGYILIYIYFGVIYLGRERGGGYSLRGLFASGGMGAPNTWFWLLLTETVEADEDDEAADGAAISFCGA